MHGVAPRHERGAREGSLLTPPSSSPRIFARLDRHDIGTYGNKHPTQDNRNDAMRESPARYANPDQSKSRQDQESNEQLLLWHREDHMTELKRFRVNGSRYPNPVLQEEGAGRLPVTSGARGGGDGVPSRLAQKRGRRARLQDLEGRYYPGRGTSQPHARLPLGGPVATEPKVRFSQKHRGDCWLEIDA